MIVPTIYCDSISVGHLAPNLVMHSEIKHVDIDFFFTGEKVLNKEISVEWRIDLFFTREKVLNKEISIECTPLEE